jgi:four helix bundle protein
MVEGIARSSPREVCRFLNVSSASLSEAAYGIHAAMRLGCVTEAEKAALEAKVKLVAWPLRGLIASYRKR